MLVSRWNGRGHDDSCQEIVGKKDRIAAQIRYKTLWRVGIMEVDAWDNRGLETNKPYINLQLRR